MTLGHVPVLSCFFIDIYLKLEKLRDSSVTQTFSASSALGMLGNPQDCFGSTVPGGSSESSSLTHQAGHACSSSEIQVLMHQCNEKVLNITCLLCSKQFAKDFFY